MSSMEALFGLEYEWSEENVWTGERGGGGAESKKVCEVRSEEAEKVATADKGVERSEKADGTEEWVTEERLVKVSSEEEDGADEATRGDEAATDTGSADESIRASEHIVLTDEDVAG